MFLDTSKPVLITGGAGYIASWTVREFLAAGFPVRATVRNKAAAEKVAHLTGLAEEFPGKLELVEADLLRPGSFEAGMQGCELVVHMASPFFIQVKDPQKELIEPALEGTRNVLNAVNATPSVKRVVLTSSVAAVMGDAADVERISGNTFDESHWNESSDLSHQAYSYSKTLAEREAWKIAGSQSRWDLVVINPAFVLGPSLSDRADGESVQFMQRMIGGDLKTGAPRLTLGVVDVRDVARAHFLAGTRAEASGRHILSAQTLTLVEMGLLLRERFGDRFPAPKGAIPKFVAYLIGPLFGLSWKFVSRNVGIPFQLDHDYSKRDLGLEYRPVADTLAEHAEQVAAARG